MIDLANYQYIIYILGAIFAVSLGYSLASHQHHWREKGTHQHGDNPSPSEIVSRLDRNEVEEVFTRIILEYPYIIRDLISNLHKHQQNEKKA